MTSEAVEVDTQIGPILASLRDEAGLTQGQLAEKVTLNKVSLSAATISRIESGAKAVTADDLSAILKAIGSPRAKEFSQYSRQSWGELERPTFDHPERDFLWKANQTLEKIKTQRENPQLKNIFVGKLDFFDRELRRVAEFLQICNHGVAFIGSIGVGKTTTICKLQGLVRQGEDKLDKEIVLDTGAGGITLCEVQIVRGPRHGLRIEPRSDDSIRKDVEDFAEYLISATQSETNLKKTVNEDDGDALGISQEVVRAIRNMARLTVEQHRVDGGKRVRIDPAKELAIKFPKPHELAIQILIRMNLVSRTQRNAWYPEGSSQPPLAWLQQIFSEVNNGRHPEFTMPSKIDILVPDPIMASLDLPLTVIDTKGINQTAERGDIESRISDPRTLVVLCTRFNEAPDLASQTLLRRAKEAGVRDIERKTVVLVLARPDEALAVKHDTGEKVEDDIDGYELKKDQIDLRLVGLDFHGLPTLFYNAKAEPPGEIREALVRKIKEYRKLYCNEIQKLSEAVDTLIQNLESETLHLVFEQVEKRLSIWLDANRTIQWPNEHVKDSLISAIDHTRYASTIRASVRRWGDWPNLDYYHHLGFGARRIAAKIIGDKVAQFKVIVDNLLADADLAQAVQFLNQMVTSLDASAVTVYEHLELAGKDGFKDWLRRDPDFWKRCDDRWGGGRGYREDIRDQTDVQLKDNYPEAYQILEDLLTQEWEEVISQLEEILREKKNTA